MRTFLPYQKNLDISSQKYSKYMLGEDLNAEDSEICLLHLLKLNVKNLANSFMFKMLKTLVV